MVWHAEGIQVVAPVKWRVLDGLVGVFWQAESQAGASGYFLSHDPRIMVFFQDVSSNISISNRGEATGAGSRPMTRAIYIPAGVPLWTRTIAQHRFSHLNLHMHKDRMLRLLSPAIGRSSAVATLKRPVEIQDTAAVESLARLMVDEVVSPSKHAVFAENIAGSIITGLLDISESAEVPAYGRLTQAQMNKLVARLNASGNGRITVAEMAATVGLSESWFATVFRQTTGKTPLQWLLGRRVELAQNLMIEGDMSLVEIAAQLGFSDQAHLTKVFRQIIGETPAAWRRMQTLS